jgi:hypothetical protein
MSGGRFLTQDAETSESGSAPADDDD